MKIYFENLAGFFEGKTVLLLHTGLARKDADKNVVLESGRNN